MMLGQLRVRLAGAQGAPPFGLQREVEPAPVADAGQAVGLAQRFELAVRFFQLGCAGSDELFEFGLVARQAPDAPVVQAPQPAHDQDGGADASQQFELFQLARIAAHAPSRSIRRAIYFAVPRSRNALVMTETELRLIASAAIIGDNSLPVNGYSRPAASGMPRAL